MTDNLPANLPATGPLSNRLEELAQAHEGEAFALLVETIRDKEQKMEHRLKAAERILDQARGKPKTALPKDPTQRKQKAVSMSIDTLMKIVQGATTRVELSDRNRRAAATLEAEFTPSPRKRPVNEYAARLPASASPLAQSDVDDLLA